MPILNSTAWYVFWTELKITVSWHAVNGSSDWNKYPAMHAAKSLNLWYFSIIIIMSRNPISVGMSVTRKSFFDAPVKSLILYTWLAYDSDDIQQNLTGNSRVVDDHVLRQNSNAAFLFVFVNLLVWLVLILFACCFLLCVWFL